MTHTSLTAKPALAALALWFCALMPAAVLGQTAGMEFNIDRRGRDYANFNLATPEPHLCANSCRSDQRCRAWTYVKPGVQGPTARCWLKVAVPPASGSDCCVSGVAGARKRQPPPPPPPTPAETKCPPGSISLLGVCSLSGPAPAR